MNFFPSFSWNSFEMLKKEAQKTKVEQSKIQCVYDKYEKDSLEYLKRIQTVNDSTDGSVSK